MSSTPPVYHTETEVLEYDPARGEWVARRRSRPFPRIPVLLFILTVASTIYTGGFPYALSIIAILLTHEMGHFLVARRHGIPATLPYFIPMPLTFFGTMGALIRMDGRRATRKQLFDVGVAGPLAGALVAIPLSGIGIRLSHVVSAAGGGSSITLGDSILFAGLQRLIHGPLPSGSTLLLHPVAFAGWAGLYVTALNLLPVGQLDGGHVLYGLFGKRAARISLIALVGFTVIALTVYRYWLIFVFLMLYLGYRHPPMLEEEVELGRGRKILGLATLALFLLAFTPVPIAVGGP